MTRHRSRPGSDRLAEAVDLLGLTDADLVVNVQGDEPLLAPAMIDACAQRLAAGPDCVMATVGHALEDAAEFANPNVVKAGDGRRWPCALFLSRTDPVVAGRRRALPRGALRHVGSMPTGPASCDASRRWPQAAGTDRIAGAVARAGMASASPCTSAPALPGPGVDTPEDLARVRAAGGRRVRAGQDAREILAPRFGGVCG